MSFVFMTICGVNINFLLYYCTVFQPNEESIGVFLYCLSDGSPPERPPNLPYLVELVLQHNEQLSLNDYAV